MIRDHREGRSHRVLCGRAGEPRCVGQGQKAAGGAGSPRKPPGYEHGRQPSPPLELLRASIRSQTACISPLGTAFGVKGFNNGSIISS